MDVEPFKIRVNQIDWTNYETAYGIAHNIPKLLIDLIGNDQQKTLDATHNLWCGLCHQHAYASSAAEPAYPFLKEVLIHTTPIIQVELLDIFYGFAVCTNPINPYPNDSFQKRLRAEMKKDLKLFESFIGKHEVDFAHLIVNELKES